MQRRRFLGTTLGAIVAGLSTRVSAGATPATRNVAGASGAAAAPRLAPRVRAIETELAAIEKRADGRLGVAVLDLETNMQAGHRLNERFPMCSTFKLLLAAAVLARVDSREEDLGERVVFGPDRLLQYAPITRGHTGEPGMTVADLCDAAVTMSDNTAANLLLDRIGGPAGFTAYARALGDTVARGFFFREEG